MICQSCGQCITLKDTNIVELNGFPCNAKWIACENCAFEIYLSAYGLFPHKTVDKCLRIYKVNI